MADPPANLNAVPVRCRRSVPAIDDGGTVLPRPAGDREGAPPTRALRFASRFLVSAALLVLILPALTGSTAAGSSANAADPPARGLRDSVLDAVSGTYSRSESDGTVGIQVGPEGLAYVRAAGSWESAGFFDGRSYAGVLCPAADSSSGSRPAAPNGLLRLRRLDDGRLEAEWSIEADDSASGRETWTRTGPSPAGVPSLGTQPPEPWNGEYRGMPDPPQAIRKVAPYYPEDARRRGIHGTVVVQALVGVDGIVKDMKIAKSIPALDRAAEACVWLWKFRPATWGGTPVAVWVGVPVKFTLD